MNPRIHRHGPLVAYILAAGGFAIAALLAMAREGRAGPRLTAHGDTLLMLSSRDAARPGRVRNALSIPLPASPWARVQRVALPGLAITPPLLLDDGTIVVGHASTHGVSWVDDSGNVRRTAALDDRPEGEMALGAEGRIYVASANRVVYVLAPDGTPRASIDIGLPAYGGPFVREDGSVMLAVNVTPLTGEVITLSASGERMGSQPLAGQVVARPALGPSNCLWVPLTLGVVCIDDTGRAAREPFGRGGSLIAPAGPDTLAVVRGHELYFYDIRGTSAARVDVGSPVQWLSALPGGGVALLRIGPPQELWVVLRNGTIVARIAMPLQVLEQPLVDPSGAMLVAARSGELIALESDGSERWRLELRQPLLRSPVALPSGGVAVIGAMGTLLLIR